MADMTRGQTLYAEDCQQRPTYHDGTPRKLWEQLGAAEQWSWERVPVMVPWESLPNPDRDHFTRLED